MQQAVTPACAKTATQDPIVRLTLTSVLPLPCNNGKLSRLPFKCDFQMQSKFVGRTFVFIKNRVKLSIGDCSNYKGFLLLKDGHLRLKIKKKRLEKGFSLFTSKCDF